jgi:hypothetical protein
MHSGYIVIQNETYTPSNSIKFHGQLHVFVLHHTPSCPITIIPIYNNVHSYNIGIKETAYLGDLVRCEGVSDDLKGEVC